MTRYRAAGLVLMVATSLIAAKRIAAQVGCPEPSTVRRAPPLADESPQYFPAGVFGSDRDVLARDYHWYLRSMGEEPLTNYVVPGHPQVYRLLVNTRPFNAPVVARLSVLTTGTGKVTAKVGRDGGHPGALTVDRTAAVSPADVARFLRVLRDADFWSMPSRTSQDIHHVVMGEEDWMLEGSDQGRYHAVDRRASMLGTLKDPAVLLLVGLAKLDLRSLPVGPRVGSHPR